MIVQMATQDRSRLRQNFVEMSELRMKESATNKGEGVIVWIVESGEDEELDVMK